MSKHVSVIPCVFLHYHGLTLPQPAAKETPDRDGGRQQQTRGRSCQQQTSSVLLRDDHIVLLAIDALLALHTSFKKWRSRRRTLRALADLDDRQLRDIGLSRDEASPGRPKSYRALAELDEIRLHLP
jgi:hypothetical protein